MAFIKGLLEFGKKQSFHPNFLSIFLNPLYFTRVRIWRAINANRHVLHGRMLDFGCGRKPYRELFQVSEYIGVDIEISGHDNAESPVDVYYDGKVLPFEDESFDSLFSSEVLEHIFNPSEILPEIYRVLKPGAVGLITVPFGWPEHEVPYDYGRYTSFGIQHLLRSHGFEIVSITKTGHYVEVLWQLFELYVFGFFKTKNQIANTILTAIFISPMTILGILLTPLAPRSTELFFNTVVVVKKPS